MNDMCDLTDHQKNQVQSMVIGNSIRSIAPTAFISYENMKTLTIGKSVEKIGDGAFADCERLLSVSLPESLTMIGEGAFTNCLSLISVYIPKSVTTIGDAAFSFCPMLKYVQVDAESQYFVSVDNVLFDYGKTKIYHYPVLKNNTEYKVPSTVVEIGGAAFESNYFLQKVYLSDNMTTLKYKAFSGCTSLTSIAIPASVTSIGTYAFRECIALSSVAYFG